MRRIDFDNVLEFLPGSLIILLFDSTASILEVLESSIETSLLVFEPILEISRISVERDLVFGHRCFEVLRDLGPVSTAICLAGAATSAEADRNSKSYDE